MVCDFVKLLLLLDILELCSLNNNIVNLSQACVYSLHANTTTQLFDWLGFECVSAKAQCQVTQIVNNGHSGIWQHIVGSYEQHIATGRNRVFVVSVSSNRSQTT